MNELQGGSEHELLTQRQEGHRQWCEGSQNTPAAREDLGTNCRRSWCGHEVFDIILTRMGLYLGRGMSWKSGVVIGLKKEIGVSRRRDGAGDKELSGRTED